MHLFAVYILVTMLISCCVAAATYQVQGGPQLHYTPANLTILQGDTVTWVFSGLHTAVQGDNCLSVLNPTINIMSSGGSVTFNQTGTYPYFCSIDGHCKLGMTGVVYVQAKSASSAQSVYTCPWLSMSSVASILGYYFVR